MSEQAIRLAAKLYDTRDSLKEILGEKYASRMAEVGAMLKDASERTGLGIMDVAGRLAKKAQADDEGMVAAMYLIAAVELLEPSAT